MSNDAAASPFVTIRDDDSPEFTLPVCISKLLALGMDAQR